MTGGSVAPVRCWTRSAVSGHPATGRALLRSVSVQCAFETSCIRGAIAWPLAHSASGGPQIRCTAPTGDGPFDLCRLDRTASGGAHPVAGWLVGR